jgi:integrase
LLIAGVHPKIVSERLGHSSIQITLDTYSHVLPGMQKESAAKLDAMLFKQDEDDGEPLFN